MAVESAGPSNARAVYAVLVILGVIAAIVASIVLGVISYNYVTRPELRNPVEEEARVQHIATLPSWLIQG